MHAVMLACTVHLSRPRPRRLAEKERSSRAVRLAASAVRGHGAGARASGQELGGRSAAPERRGGRAHGGREGRGPGRGGDAPETGGKAGGFGAEGQAERPTPGGRVFSYIIRNKL